LTTALVPHTTEGVLALPEQEQARILQSLGLDIRSPLTRALLLVAERYDLDPLLKQVQIIKQNVYITHAGLLHIAHASNKLDGIVVEEEGEDKDSYYARVSVYRKDMSKPFTYSGEFRKSKVRSDGASGREMALKNAERSALRRAFDIGAPTMDDSGTDMDDVVPMGDIDLPPTKPALPSADANALPVPEATPPAKSQMPDPKAPENGTKLPLETLKVPIPETGEIVYMKNGHLINPKTGGEMFCATDEQKALQERARQIVAEAQARVDAAEGDLAKKVPATKATRATKATKKAAPKPEDAEPTYTEEQIKRAQHLHMRAKELDIEESLLRDIVYAISDKRTKSTREVAKDESDTVEAMMVAINQEIVDLSYDEEGVLIFEMMMNPLPPDDAVEDAEVVNEPTDWKAEIEKLGIKEGMFLRRARAIADEIGVPMPASTREISGEKLEAALREWVKEFAQ